MSDMPTPKIGAFVLESLTTGMYPDPLDAVRELVQNASDSIREAERTKLITPGTGRIHINLDPQHRRASVEDTGVGIPQEVAAASLLNIGMSAKSIERDAGFRGIGRLAAIAYCDRLTFTTAADGEGVTTSVSLDCKGIRRSISPALRDASLRSVAELADVLKTSATIKSEERTEKKKHGFKVELEGISESGGAFLDFQKIEQYLSQVAPVDFDRQRFPYAPKIDKWAETHGFLIPKVILEIRTPPNKTRLVYKHYVSHYKPSKSEEHFDIKDVEFFRSEGTLKDSFWVWYGVNSDFPGMIGNEDCRGLRLRKKNIGLGSPDRVADLFEQLAASYGRFNYYFIGEVHVDHPQAVPNARRDGFEQEGVWPEIVQELRPFIEKRCADAYQGSKTRNQSTDRVVRQIEDSAAKIEDRLSGGIMAQAEKEKLVKQIETAKSKAQQATENGRTAEEKAKIRKAILHLDQLQAKVSDPTAFVGGKIKSHLDRKERKVLRDVLEIVYGALDGVDCAKRHSCVANVKRAVMERYGADSTGGKQ
jgi:hypothetical protein